MKIKLYCNKCNSKVDNLSIVYENVTYREDVRLRRGEFVADGEEYFQGRIKAIVFNCENCGEISDKYYKHEKPFVLKPFLNSHLIEVEKTLKIVME